MDARQLLADLVSVDLPTLDGGVPLNTLPRFDSLAMVNLVLQVEGIVGRQLTEEELESMNTVGDLQKILSAE